MRKDSVYQDFTATAKFFHWLMAAIIIVGWFVGFYAAEMLSYSVPHSGKAEMITLHKDIATTVLLLIVLRADSSSTACTGHICLPAFRRTGGSFHALFPDGRDDDFRLGQ
jgi:cytochrome b561